MPPTKLVKWAALAVSPGSRAVLFGAIAPSPSSNAGSNQVGEAVPDSSDPSTGTQARTGAFAATSTVSSVVVHVALVIVSTSPALTVPPWWAVPLIACTGADCRNMDCSA